MSKPRFDNGSVVNLFHKILLLPSFITHNLKFPVLRLCGMRGEERWPVEKSTKPILSQASQNVQHCGKKFARFELSVVYSRFL